MQKRLVLVCEDSLCLRKQPDVSLCLRKQPDVSRPGLGEAGRYNAGVHGARGGARGGAGPSCMLDMMLLMM